MDSPPGGAPRTGARRQPLPRIAVALIVGALATIVPAAVGGGRATAEPRGERPLPRIERGLPFGSTSGTLDVHQPARHTGRLRPGVLVVHGGGWRHGSARKMGLVSRALARRGLVAFNLEYTLATLAQPGYAVQPAELRAAVRWIRRNSRRFGVDPRRVGALGSSAGAHLATLTGLRGQGPLTAGDRLAAVVAWSGPFDLAAETAVLAPAIAAFLGCAPAVCPERAAAASPLAHVSPEDPAMLVVSSERELVPSSHAHALGAALDEAGVPNRVLILPGSRHGREYAGTALAPSIDFLRSRLR